MATRNKKLNRNWQQLSLDIAKSSDEKDCRTSCFWCVTLSPCSLPAIHRIAAIDKNNISVLQFQAPFVGYDAFPCSFRIKIECCTSRLTYFLPDVGIITRCRSPSINLESTLIKQNPASFSSRKLRQITVFWTGNRAQAFKINSFGAYCWMRKIGHIQRWLKQKKHIKPFSNFNLKSHRYLLCSLTTCAPGGIWDQMDYYTL